MGAVDDLMSENSKLILALQSAEAERDALKQAVQTFCEGIKNATFVDRRIKVLADKLARSLPQTIEGK